MKILVTGTPRSGTSAYCRTLYRTNIVKQNFDECLWIEDLIIPRDEHTTKILYKLCNKKFLHCLENFDWDRAWLNKPKSKLDSYYYLDFDNHMHQYRKKELPRSLEDFKAQQLTRWNRLKKINSWSIKLFRFHGVHQNIVEDIKNTVDRIDILFRRDKIQQAISGIIAKEVGSWGYVEYNNKDPNWFDYTKFEQRIKTIIKEENYIIENFYRKDPATVYVGPITRILYYEDLDLTSSDLLKKNKYSIIYDLDRCKEIVRKYE